MKDMVWGNLAAFPNSETAGNCRLRQWIRHCEWLRETQQTYLTDHAPQLYPAHGRRTPFESDQTALTNDCCCCWRVAPPTLDARCTCWWKLSSSVILATAVGRSSDSSDVRFEEGGASSRIGICGIFGRVWKSRTSNARTMDGLGFSMPVESA